MCEGFSAHMQLKVSSFFVDYIQINGSSRPIVAASQFQVKTKLVLHI